MSEQPNAIYTPTTGIDILDAQHPDPVIVVPDLFSSGLGFLGGRPKVGKSWLALQLAFSVTSGGRFLNRPIEQGKVLYLALEDNPRRLQQRMQAQGWTYDAAQYLSVITLEDFRKNIGFLHMRGATGKLYSLIERGDYRLVVVDTLGRAFSGLRDLDKAEVITPALSPLQEMAITREYLTLFLDHHAKPKGFNSNPVDDLMSSTAKSAVADTLAGLYRDDNGAKKLMVTGRDVEEKTLVIRWDRLTYCYQLIEDEAQAMGLTANEGKVYRWLKEHGPARHGEISRGTGIAGGNLSPILSGLVTAELITYDSEGKTFYVE